MPPANSGMEHAPGTETPDRVGERLDGGDRCIRPDPMTQVEDVPRRGSRFLEDARARRLDSFAGSVERGGIEISLHRRAPRDLPARASERRLPVEAEDI